MSTSDSLLDDPHFRELIDRFVNEMPDRCAAIRGEIESGQLAEASRFAHQLKGAGASFGFPELTQPASVVERLCAENCQCPELNEAFTRLVDTVEAAARRWGRRHAHSESAADVAAPMRSLPT